MLNASLGQRSRQRTTLLEHDTSLYKSRSLTLHNYTSLSLEHFVNTHLHFNNVYGYSVLYFPWQLNFFINFLSSEAVIISLKFLATVDILPKTSIFVNIYYHDWFQCEPDWFKGYQGYILGYRHF